MIDSSHFLPRNISTPHALRVSVVVISTAAIAFLLMPLRHYFMKESKGAGLVDVQDHCTFDFGTLSQAEARHASHRFVLTNNGSVPIKILAVATSCGCTVADVPRREVAPGAAMPIFVTANWSQVAGDQGSQVVVQSDFGESPAVVLTIHATVTCGCVVTPNVVDFGHVQQGESATRQLFVTGGSDYPQMKVTDIVASDNRIEVARANRSASAVDALPGPGGEFALTFHADSALGEFRGRVVFNTSVDGMPRLLVVWKGLVLPPIAVSPSALLIIAGNNGAGIGKLKVFSDSTEPVVAVVDDSRGRTLVTASSREKGVCAEITVRVSADSVPFERHVISVAQGKNTVAVPLIVTRPFQQ